MSIHSMRFGLANRFNSVFPLHCFLGHVTSEIGDYLMNNAELVYRGLCLQCFDAIGWAAGRASGL